MSTAAGTVKHKPLWTGFEPSRAQFSRVVDGEGVHLILEDGRRVLDGTNTGAPLGSRRGFAIKRATLDNDEHAS